MQRNHFCIPFGGCLTLPSIPSLPSPLAYFEGGRREVDRDSDANVSVVARARRTFLFEININWNSSSLINVDTANVSSPSSSSFSCSDLIMTGCAGGAQIFSSIPFAQPPGGVIKALTLITSHVR